MTPASNRKNGRVCRYYRCATRDKEGAGACGTMPLPADAIEGLVVEKIRDAIRTAKLGEEVTLAMQERIATRRAELQQMRQGLPADVQRLRLESGALAERVTSAAGPAIAVLGQRLTETSEALARTEEMLRQVDRGIALIAQAEVDARWVARALTNFEAVWDVMTPENRGRLVRALVEK